MGDVETTGENDISIDASYAKGGEIAVGGTVKNGETGATLYVNGENGVMADGIQLPEIVVGTIEDIEKLSVKTADNVELDKEVTAEVISNIKYIIDQDDLKNGTLTVTKLDGSALERDSSDGYDVAKASETFKVKIVPVSGYKVSGFSSGKAAFVRNEDGSYTVTVPAGGGVSLSAVLEAIEKAAEKTPEKTETTVVTKTYSSGGGSGASSSGLHAVTVTPGAGRTNNATTPGSWQKNADNTWSYVSADGETYKSSWIVSNNRWYYADANGRIATGWMEINGVWYYFSVAESSENPEGAMLAGTTTPDGYKLDSSGAWVK